MARALATEQEKEFYKKQMQIRTNDLSFGTPGYYRYPEGEDLFGKLRFTTKWAAVAGGAFGLTKAAAVAKKMEYKEWTFLFLKPVVPAVGMAAMFTVTTYFATNFRKKDDVINYGLGGATAGLVFGAALRSVPHGLAGVFLFSLLACYIKNKGDRPLIEPINKIYFSPYEARAYDFSLTPPKKGNWSKEKVSDQ